MPDRPVMTIQALSSADLVSFTLPEKPFRIGPRNFRVVDGDTIKVVSGQRDMLGREIAVLRLRFRSIAAPETRKMSWEDRPLAALGADPNRFCPGRRARDLLGKFTRGRDIIVSHQGFYDPYGRLLADICVLPHRNASLEEAISLERVMLARGAVQRFGSQTIPDLHPFGNSFSLSP